MAANSAYRIFADSFAVARAIAAERGVRSGVAYFIGVRGRGFYRFLFDLHSIVYARLSGKPLVHVIGDSHAKVFRGQRLFIVHHMGAATAHNLAKASSTTSSNRKLFDAISRMRSGDFAVLVFGEIDCRIHIYNQYEKNDRKRPIRELIDDTVFNYGVIMEELTRLGIRFAVYGVPPATKARNEYHYTFYAPPEEHCRISGMFNERLKGLCARNDYPFIDVYSRFSDEDGFMLREYAADEVHLNGKTVGCVKAELRDQLGIPV